MSNQNPRIPIAKPWLGEPEAEAARRVILSAWVTQGPEVASFEHDFAESVHAKFACAVSSGTAALHLALLAVGVQAGDEVITVSHSFIATANSIRHCGAKPVFVDINPETYNINPLSIESAITERSRALLCVHQMGMPCDMNAIMTLAKRYDLPVVEDAACAVGSEIKFGHAWEKIGKPHGDIACFSFHPRKIITTGDGGMLTTQNREYDRKFRLWRQNGMSISDTVRHVTDKVVFESYPEPGYNYRLTDIQAAIGREQLKRLPGIITRRRILAERYRKSLSRIRNLILPEDPSWAKSNWQSYCVRLPASYEQREIMQLLLNSGVASRRGIMCAHREAAYREAEGRHVLSESESAQEQCILLPLYAQMSDEEQHFVIEAITDVLKKSVF